jgi:hypothetical protein
MALTQDKGTARRVGDVVNHPVAASQNLFLGAIGMLNASGFLVKGSTATGLKPAGVIQARIDNSAGADGDNTVDVRKGCYLFKNDGSVTRVDIGSMAYVVDDETVANSDGTGTRSGLGQIVDLDDDGVWVTIA